LLPRPGSFSNAGLILGLGSRIWCSSARYGFSPICTTGPNFRNFAPATVVVSYICVCVALLLLAFINFVDINDFNFFLISACLAASSSRYFCSYCSFSPSRPAISPLMCALIEFERMPASSCEDTDAVFCYTYLPFSVCALPTYFSLMANGS